MINEEVMSLLKEYGLDQKESIVYLSLVGNKELNAYRIAKITSLNRSTTYDVLERLLTKGFVSRIEKNGVIYYDAREITTVLSQLKNKESILISLLPVFEKLQKSTRPTSRVLEDVGAQKQFNIVLINALKKSKSPYVYVLGNGPSPFLSTNLFHDNVLKEVKMQKLHQRIDYKAIWDPKFRKNPVLKKYSFLHNNRFLKLPSLVTTVIFPGCVAYLFTTDKSYVVEINNELVVEEMKAYFQHLWSIAS